MPGVLIEIRRQYNKEDEVCLINAVHLALLTSFKIPPTDKTIRLVVHEPHRFAVPPDKNKPDYYTYISIDAFAGRSIDAKRKLYQEIVNNLAPFGIPKDHILIVLKESNAENWGVQGGQVASEVDLGFKVNV